MLTSKQQRRKERHEHRKVHGLCVQCGKKLQQRIMTERCARCKKRASRANKRWRKRHPEAVARQRQWLKNDRAKDPAKYRKIRRRLYREKQKLKLCVTCPTRAKQPAVLGSTECEKHLAESRAYSLAYYRKNGRKKRKDREKAQRGGRRKRVTRCRGCGSARHTMRTCKKAKVARG